MSERLNGIEAFVAAVEAGNFALAAERLHLSRSAVGKNVARLKGGWARACSIARRAARA